MLCRHFEIHLRLVWGRSLCQTVWGRSLCQTAVMAKKPEFNRVGASTYACTVCTNFKLEITKKMNAGELQRLLEVRLEHHIRQYHATERGFRGWKNRA